MAKNPIMLAKAIGDIQETALQAHEAARTNPYNTASIPSKQTLTHGVTVNIEHGLGATYGRCQIAHAHPGSMPMSSLVEVTPPPGKNKSTTCSFVPMGYMTLGGTVSLVSGVATVTFSSGTDPTAVNLQNIGPHGTLGTHYASNVTNYYGQGYVLTIYSINTSGATVTTDTSLINWSAQSPSTGTYDINITPA